MYGDSMRDELAQLRAENERMRADLKMRDEAAKAWTKLTESQEREIEGFWAALSAARCYVVSATGDTRLSRNGREEAASRLKMVDAALNHEQEPRHGDMVECTKCGAQVRFGSCCDICDEPSDH